MIFWEKLKIQKGAAQAIIQLDNDNNLNIDRPTNISGTLSASTISASTLSVANSITLPTNTQFSGAVSLPAGTTFSSPVSLPANSTLQGAVTLPTGSSFAGSINIPGGSVGMFDKLTVTQTLNVGGQPTLNLAEGSTYAGRKFVVWPQQAGFWLDAYQGAGENWITIRNYTNYTLNISSLTFSGNTWATGGNDPAPGAIEPHGTWSRSAYHGWGSNDNPSPITLTYSSSNNSTAVTKTFTVGEWTKPGGILFGEEGTYPGQLLLQNDNTLVILYSSTDKKDLKAWFSFATSYGYNQNCTYYGVNMVGAATAGTILGDTELAGTYILTFRK